MANWCTFQVGVKHLVVFLNKADIVEDEEVLELVSLLAPYFFDNVCLPLLLLLLLHAIQQRRQKWKSLTFFPQPYNGLNDSSLASKQHKAQRFQLFHHHLQYFVINNCFQLAKIVNI